jgi:hypothetical protein
MVASCPVLSVSYQAERDVRPIKVQQRTSGDLGVAVRRVPVRCSLTPAVGAYAGCLKMYCSSLAACHVR